MCQECFSKVIDLSAEDLNLIGKATQRHNKQLTQNEALEMCLDRWGDRYDYSKMVYINMHQKSEFICRIHGSFWQQFQSHITGCGCPKCGNIKTGLSRKKCLQEIVNKANAKHNFKYNYSLLFALKDYKGTHLIYPIICKEHGIFWQKIDNHLCGKGCPKCAHIKNGNRLRRNILDVLKEANQKHNFFYKYSHIKENDYKSNVTKLPIECPIHGLFKQSMSDHLQGKGCPKCGGSAQLNTEEFIQRAILKHKNKYDYSKVIYIKSMLNVVIICPIHGDFLQTPDNHLSGSGCLKCGRILISQKQRGNIKEIIERANKLFEIPYDYSLIKEADYKNNTTKLPIICPYCGKIFYKSMCKHLLGRGCPCQKQSKGELFISKILKNLNIY